MIRTIKFIAIAAILVRSSAVFADGGQAGSTIAPDQPDLSLVPVMARPLHVDAKTGEQDLLQQAGTATFLKGLNLVQGAAAAANSPQLAPFQNLAAKGERQGDITLEKDRAAVLRFLGLDPAARHGQVYYFVSLSMPQSLLREYALDAMWSGGRLILRGMDPAMPDLRSFIAKELQPLVQFKGGAAEISIDPRLYDTYQITSVPTIVYSTLPETGLCTQEQAQTVQDGDKTWQFNKCSNLADPDKYWKIEGAVSTVYALQAFQQQGAPVDYLLTAMQKAAAAGAPVNVNEGQAAAGFTGDWKKIVTPSEIMAIESSVNGINGVGGSGGQQTYAFPAGNNEFGLAVGPKGLKAETQAHQQVLVPVSDMLQQHAQQSQ